MLGLMTTLGLGLISTHTSATTTYVIVEGKSGTMNVSLADLQGMETVQRLSSYQNSVGNWKGNGTYVGVNISSLVNLVGGMTPGDTVTVYASDNYNQTYSYYNVFNAWPDPSIQGSMILAYSFNGVDVPNWTSGLRIAFLPDDHAYSNADCLATTTPDESSGSAGARWVSSVSSIVVHAAPWTVTLKKDTSTMTYGGQQIANMTSVTASGGYRKSNGAIVGPNSYTGVNVGYLTQWVGGMSPPDSLKVISRDNHTQTLNYSLATGNATVWTVLSYKIDGAPMATSDVPRITFIGPSSPITSSSLWQKAVSSMEVMANQPPVLQPLVDVSGFAGQTLTFTASATDSDRDALRYTWDFGDGTAMQVGKTTTHTYANCGVYSFTVCVDDMTGLVGHNITGSATATIAFNLVLVAGWNFVSIPIAGVSYNASTLGLTAGDEVVGWNSSLQIYDQDYIVGLSPLTADFTLNESTGYWIYAIGYEEVLINGSTPISTQSRMIDVPSGGGWVAIGLDSMNMTRSASDVVAMFSSGSLTDLARWNTTTGHYDGYIVGIDPSINDFTLSPGEAYWIWVTASGTLTYDP
jgi:hypothetical protein